MKTLNVKSKTSKEVEKEILKVKISGLKQAKKNSNFQNTLRRMVIALKDKAKILNQNLVWSANFIEKSANLKDKMRGLKISDPANFEKSFKFFETILKTDFSKLRENADSKLKRDLDSCVNDEQKAIVSEYYEFKTLAEINLKESIQNVLVSEGFTMPENKIEEITE